MTVLNHKWMMIVGISLKEGEKFCGFFEAKVNRSSESNGSLKIKAMQH